MARTAKASDMVWARRQFAGILISRRDYKSFQKAKSLIEENMASSEASSVDRSLLAKLKASDPKQGERDEAMAILERLDRGPIGHAGRRLGTRQNVNGVGRLDGGKRSASRPCGGQ